MSHLLIFVCICSKYGSNFAKQQQQPLNSIMSEAKDEGLNSETIVLIILLKPLHKQNFSHRLHNLTDLQVP